MKRLPAILALALTYMVFAMLLNSVAAVILQSMLTFHVDKLATSTLDACKDLPIAITSILLAARVPQLGYRRSMIAGLLLVAAACVAMPLLASFPVTRLTFVVIGASFAVTKISVYSAIGLVTGDAKEHASITSTIEGLFMVGVLSTSWLFGAFINDADPGDPGWLRVYWVLGALAATAAVVWMLVPLDESRVHIGEGGTGIRDNLREMAELCRSRLVLVFVATAFIYVLVEQAVQTWLPTFNKEVLGLPAVLSVQLASMYSGGLAAGRLSAGILLRYTRWLVLLTTCLVVAGAILIASVRGGPGVTPAATGWASVPLQAYLLPLLGLFLAPVYPTICSTMLSALPLRQHAPMTGLIVVFSALGGTLGSFITGRVFAATDGRTAFSLALLPLAMLGLLLAYFDRGLRRRQGHAGADVGALIP